MTSKTGTRFGLATLVVMVLVAAAGVAAMRGTWQWPRSQTAATESGELVTFVIKFEPTLRDKDVTITLSAGDFHKGDLTKHSPWSYERMVRPGTPVKLLAVQIEDGHLECYVRQGFRKLAEQDNRRLKGKQVHCEGVVA